jgi:hypothetical protein
LKLSEIISFGVANGLLDPGELRVVSPQQMFEMIRAVQAEMDGHLLRQLDSVEELLFEAIDWINQRKIRATSERFYPEADLLHEELNAFQRFVGQGIDGNKYNILVACQKLFRDPCPPPVFLRGRDVDLWEKRQLRLVLERQEYWKIRKERILEQEFRKAKDQGYWD